MFLNRMPKQQVSDPPPAPTGLDAPAASAPVLNLLLRHGQVAFSPKAKLRCKQL